MSMLLTLLADLPEGEPREVHAGDDSLILVRFGDAVHGYHNICPHAGRALNWAPGRFLLNAGELVCAAHGASFTLATGACTGGPCRGSSLKPVALAVRDGGVHLA